METFYYLMILWQIMDFAPLVHILIIQQCYVAHVVGTSLEITKVRERLVGRNGGFIYSRVGRV